MAKNYNAKQVYRNFIIYNHYLIENNLENDSKTISVSALMDFVENEIDDEDKERIEKIINIFF